MVLTGLARLEVSPPAKWLDAVLGAAFEVLPLFAPQECSCLLLALAKLRHIPGEGWMDAFWMDTVDKVGVRLECGSGCGYDDGHQGVHVELGEVVCKEQQGVWVL